MNVPVETLADPLVAHARAMLAHFGENPHRPGLAETPKRFASAMRFLTAATKPSPRTSTRTTRWPARMSSP